MRRFLKSIKDEMSSEHTRITVERKALEQLVEAYEKLLAEKNQDK